jgi:hypothetical protein
MNSPFEHALGLLKHAHDDLYVVRRLRSDPDAPGWVLGFHAQQAVECFGTLVPFGVVMRYEDAITDEAPPMDGDWLDALVTRTLTWADDCLTMNKDTN